MPQELLVSPSYSFSFPLHGFQKSLREAKLQLWEALARLQPIFRTKPALPAPRHSRLPTLLFATPLNTLAFYLPSHPLGASLLSKRPPWGFPGSPQLGLCLPLQGALGSVPGRGTKNPHAIQHKPLPQKGPPGARGKSDESRPPPMGRFSGQPSSQARTPHIIPEGSHHLWEKGSPFSLFVLEMWAHSHSRGNRIQGREPFCCQIL